MDDQQSSELDDLERVLRNPRAEPIKLSYKVIQSITDDFSKKEVIGHGGFGIVYKGIHRNRKIAVKKILILDDNNLFMDEIMVLRRVRHENIVRFLGYCVDTPADVREFKKRMVVVDAPQRLLCFEFVPNGDLHSYIENKSQGDDWGIRYHLIKGICQGLQYLHKQSIIHADLKPENVLLDACMEPKITDFGLSKCIDKGKSAILAEKGVGTLGFMAPEVIDEGKYSFKSDTYALGVIIMRVLTGSNSNTNDNKNWHKSARVDNPEMKSCIEIAQICMQRDPDKRLTAKEIIDKLNAMESMLEEVNDQINPFESKELIKVDPLELHFDPEKGFMEVPVNIINFTDNYVAFSIKWVCPSGLTNYYLSPYETDGVLLPRTTRAYRIERKTWEGDEAPFSVECNDTLQVRSTLVTDFFDVSDISDNMFKPRAGRAAQIVEVPVVLVAPSLPRVLEGFLNKLQSSAWRDTNSQAIIPELSDLLEIYPPELHIPFEPNKSIPCSLHLTNKTNTNVAFTLTKDLLLVSNVNLELYGVVPPWSSYTLVVIIKTGERYRKRIRLTNKLPEDPDFTMILQYGLCDIHNRADAEYIHTFKERGGSDNILEKLGCTVAHTVKVRGFYVPPREMTTSEHTTGHRLKIISVMDHPMYLEPECMEANPTMQWMATTGHYDGTVSILNYTQQSSFDFLGEGVYSPKFIVQKQWFMVSSTDGFIHVHNYETKTEQMAFRAGVSHVTSLAVHPTKPYLLSSCAETGLIKLWEYSDLDCKCTKTFFNEDAGNILHLVFNPSDTDSFASALDDHRVKIWNIDSTQHNHVLHGHSDKVNCLDFFTCNDQQYLITGSNDQTAMIWDMQKNTCVYTMEGFMSAVISVYSHPNLPILITGEYGIVRLWSSTDFRLQRILQIGQSGKVLSLSCSAGSTRVVIGQQKVISVVDIDNEESVASEGKNEPGDMDISSNKWGKLVEEANLDTKFYQEQSILGIKETAYEIIQASSCSELLAVHPLELRFPFEPNKSTPCSLHLKNKTDEHAAFRLKKTLGQCFISLPLYGYYGIVPPKSTYTLILITEELWELPEETNFDMILESNNIPRDKYIELFQNQIECHQCFEEETANEVTVKAFLTPKGHTTSEILSMENSCGIKILSMEKFCLSLYSMDTNLTRQWIITITGVGEVGIQNYDTEEQVDTFDIGKNAVWSVRFIERKQWFVAGCSAGFIHVYSYKGKMQKIKKFIASDGTVSSLAVHPTKPYVLSLSDREMKLWDWEDDWKCTQTFNDEHDGFISQVVFNPNDTDYFASASEDHTVKVWSLESSESHYTLSGHLNKVKCLDFFTHDDQHYLITGSDDCTVKIWDLQTSTTGKRECVDTLKDFMYPVNHVLSLPDHGYLITGSADGTVHLWSSTCALANASTNAATNCGTKCAFRLQRIIKFSCGGDILDIRCLIGSRRFVVGQSEALTILDIDIEEVTRNGNNEIKEDMDIFSKQRGDVVGEGNLHLTFNEKVIVSRPKGTTSEVIEAGSCHELLDFHPPELYFPFVPNKSIPCSLHLTNKTEERVAFRLRNNVGISTWRSLVSLPLYGIVPPGSTYTVVVTTKEREELPEETDFNMVLDSSTISRDITTFENHSKCEQFFDEVKETMNEVTLKAHFAPRGLPTTSKILSVEKLRESLSSFDTNPTKQWIITGQYTGHVGIWSYQTQKRVGWFKFPKRSVRSVKFIERKQWFIVGSSDGFIHVYTYETEMKQIKRFKAADYSIDSLVVHPTKSYVLSLVLGEMKIWDWDNGWICIQTFEIEHSETVLQVVFNPNDTDSFASASKDQTVKVWNLYSSKSLYTLSEHLKRVNCLDFFTHDNRCYLVSGSDDCTAKIWDLQTKACVDTLEDFVSPVNSVFFLPDHSYLLTGSGEGIVHLWSCPNFRRQRIINFGFNGNILGVRCLMGPRRVVIGQDMAVTIMDIDTEEISSNGNILEGQTYIFSKERASVVGEVDLHAIFNEQLVVSGPKGLTSEVNKDGPYRDLLGVDKMELYFPFVPNKSVPCSLHLTNKTDERVAFRLRNNVGVSNWRSLVSLPLYGIVPPGSTYTVVVTTKEREELPEETDFNMILDSSTISRDITMFDNIYDCAQFFEEVEVKASVVTLKGVFAPQGHPTTSEILSVDKLDETLSSLDTNLTKQWIITYQYPGHVGIWCYHTQKQVGSFRIPMEKVKSVKLIQQKQWLVAGSYDGFIHVYTYEREMQEIKKFRVADYSIDSLVVHPTKPYVLSLVLGEMKIWDWDNSWICIQTFEMEHSEPILQVLFSPNDGNCFATASRDETVKVWSLDSSKSLYTLSGHLDRVNCLDFFTHNDRHCLITGSDDCTIKIWDLQAKNCVGTLEVPTFPVNYVMSLPDRSYVITGSGEGIVHLWSYPNFRLERIINFGCNGDIVGLGCLMGSRRVVIGQQFAVSVVDIDVEVAVPNKGNNEAQEDIEIFSKERGNVLNDEKLDAIFYEQLAVSGSNGITSEQVIQAGSSSELLDVDKLELRFLFEPNKSAPCLLHLTNKTEEHVAFMLTDKAGTSWRCFVSVPLYGIVPPRTTYTLVVTTEKLEELPEERDFDMILKSSTISRDIMMFENKFECDQFFQQVEKTVDVVTLKALFASEILSMDNSYGMKILSVEKLQDILSSFDTNLTKQWITTAQFLGYVSIWCNQTKKLVGSFKIPKETVQFVKFIERKQWFVAGSSDGFIHVYTYEPSIQKIKRFRAADYSLDSLTVHPTKSYVLSRAYCEMKLWDWDEGWLCTRTFEKEHSDTILQVAFNPNDTNSFASASKDHTIKVWSLDSSVSHYTLSEHLDKVNCLDFFTRDDQHYLISGSDDCTAKIWDLQIKKCVDTLEVFTSPVKCVICLPERQYIVTGSGEGIVHLWSSSNFSLQRIINFGCNGETMGVACLMASGRLVIGQDYAMSIMDIGNEDPLQQ